MEPLSHPFDHIGHGRTSSLFYILCTLSHVLGKSSSHLRFFLFIYDNTPIYDSFIYDLTPTTNLSEGTPLGQITPKLPTLLQQASTRGPPFLMPRVVLQLPPPTPTWDPYSPHLNCLLRPLHPFPT